MVIQMNPTFRQFVLKFWYQHLEELMAWEHTVPKYTSVEYFEKYRWWLRKEYRKYINGSSYVS